MKRNGKHIGLLFLLLAGLVNSPSSFALRCGGSLITAGNSKLFVQNKCGEPSWIDRWSTETVNNPDTNLEHSVIAFQERWAYNRGPTRFISVVTFSGSEVVSVERSGRGFRETHFGSQSCNLDRFAIGTASAEVYAKCGKPDLQEQRIETITHGIEGGRKQTTVTVDEWTFNLGPTRFLRIVTFRNGALIGVETGEKGFK